MEGERELVKKAKRANKILVFAVLLAVLFGLIFGYIYFVQNAGDGEIIQNTLGDNKNYTRVDALLIALMLAEFGAGKLHRNPIGFEKPIICIKIDNREYIGVISKNIEVKEEICSGQDINIISSEQEILSIINGDSANAVKDSVSSGKTKISLVAGKVELLAKGYMEIYDGFR